jgi:hypothetical protein
MKTNTDILVNFIFTIAFTVLIFSVLKINKDNKIMRTEIDELRVLFNQKFLQEMVVNEPEIKDLTYRTTGSTKSLKKFEF